VESAWYVHLKPKAGDELAHKGSLAFYMGKKRWARLGRGHLEFADKKDGQVSRCEASEIGSARLAPGTFKLTPKDATSRFFGFLGESGVFHFNHGNMYNGRLFLHEFNKLAGVNVE
jgi:hypothetical protein